MQFSSGTNVQFSAAVNRLALRRCADRLLYRVCYRCVLMTGSVPARPWSGQRETSQTEGSVRRDLIRAGFTDITFAHLVGKLIIEARNPSVV